MNSFYLFIFELASLVCLTGVLIMLYGLRHAPLGFQHYPLFYFGEPPTGLIPVESRESTPPAPANAAQQ